MNISTRKNAEILIIDIEGKLDTQTSDQALVELTRCLEHRPVSVLISLALLDFISSAGLRVILRIAKNVRENGAELRISGARGVVKEVLEISGFDSLLDLCEDEAQAIKSLQ